MKCAVLASVTLIAIAVTPAMAVGISNPGGGPPKKVLSPAQTMRAQPAAAAKAKVVTPAANVKATGKVGR